MTLEERVYSTLVISASEKFKNAMKSLLVHAHCEPVHFVGSVSSAKRMILEKQFDFVIINSPLPDDQGLKLAVDITTSKSSACLVLVGSDIFSDVHAQLTSYGVFTLSRPSSVSIVENALDFMAAMRERMRGFEKRNESIEEKMEEIRLVNRAKWSLIKNLEMTEPDAHRYIEKQAMDRCISKRVVATEILNTYS